METPPACADGAPKWSLRCERQRRLRITIQRLHDPLRIFPHDAVEPGIGWLAVVELRKRRSPTLDVLTLFWRELRRGVDVADAGTSQPAGLRRGEVRYLDLTFH